jgi:hypothetical protein
MAEDMEPSDSCVKYRAPLMEGGLHICVVASLVLPSFASS